MNSHSDLYKEAFLKLVSAFNKFEVKFLIVGGFATNYHGYLRATGDIDFWLKDTLQNRKALIEAIDFLGMGQFPELIDAPLMPGFCEIILNQGIYADLMNEIHGFDQTDFDRCYQDASITQIDNIEIRFINFSDHLESKKTSTRLKDKLDVEELIKIQRKNK